MKKSSKNGLKKARGNNTKSVLIWAPLLVVISISLAVLWEDLNTTKTEKKLPIQTDKHPEYVLDFQAALKEREEQLKKYKHDLQTTGVERRSNLSLQEFWDLYDAKWPVIITDVVNTWPASKWTTEFFNLTYGNENVATSIVEGTTSEGFSVPLHGFIKYINYATPTSWMYVMDEVFIVSRPELHKQILPSIYTEEDFFKLFPKEIRPWDCMLLWGSAYSQSPLHIDPYNWTGTNAVIKGTKKWKLFPPGQDHLLYVIPEAMCGFPLECYKYNSPINTFAPDQTQYPLYNLATYIEVEQKAGEMLIIPTGWFHQVYNTEETLAISNQVMNRNNYRYVLKEILKAGNLLHKHLPDNFHNLSPKHQVRILMSLLPKRVLQEGEKRSQDYINSIKGQHST
ncbi:hypothetical protein C0Q70_08818 [Pomacea canaliculata]|uniref:JmjC domain-containing protein n=1 Tax=Pomacea canaliculata TaxID=400727 RepID=A0A2T7P818_POMCA|nr:F-box protein At1g78280-like [Pomacea canaliculata]PVD29564.1 hypothetical protein C0Q70_08818 [Pomacea canaliculata]